MPQIEDRAPTGRLDALEGHVELGATVALQRVEHLAGQALAVDPNQQILCGLDLAGDHRQVLLVGAGANLAIHDHPKRPKTRG